MSRLWKVVPALVGATCMLAACNGPVPTGSAAVSEAAITIPSCGEEGECAQGFTIAGRYYFIVCTEVRPEAVDDYEFAAANGAFSEVRRILGLTPELFLAVSGDIACSPGGPWWLAQTENAVEELDPPLRDRLRDALRP